MAITLNQHRKGITQTLIATFSDNKDPKSGFSFAFPSKTTASKNISIEVERNLQLVAVDVQRCTDPVRNTFSKSTEKIFQPPYYNESFDYTSCERYDVTFGMGQGPTKMDAKMLVRSAQRKIKALKNKILRAIELQRAQVLESGIVTLKNGDSIDYRRAAESMVVKAGAATWDNADTSTPLTDLEDGMEFLRETGLSGGSTVNAVFGKDAFKNLMSNEKFIAEADIRNIKRMDIGMPQFNNVSGMVFHGQLATGDYIVNLWTYNEMYVDPADGLKKRYLKTDNVVLVAEDFEGNTAFAGVPAILGNADGGFYVAPKEGEFYVRDVIDQTRLSWDFIISSAPLVVPISIDRLYTIQTKS